MPTQNVKDFNTVNLLNLRDDSILSIQNNELVRLNGQNTLLSGINQMSVNNLNVTGSLSTINRPTVNGTNVMLVGEASQTDTAYFSYIPPSDINLGLATDYFPPFNTTVYNTNTSVFELVNSGGTPSTARINIKSAGYYNIQFRYFGYDLKTQNRVIFKLFSSSTSTSSLNFVKWFAKNRYAGLDSDGDQMEGSINIYVSTPGFYTCAMFSQDLNPYTLRGLAITYDIPTFSLYLTRLRGV